MIRNIILSKVKEYLNLKGIATKKIGKMITFDCVYCGKLANSIPNSTQLNCMAGNKRYTLIDIVRKLENKEGNDDEIIEYLKGLLKIDGIITKKEENKTKELLDFYEKNNWSLMALSPNTKIPIEGSKEWEKKEYKNKEEHKQWLDNGLNLATRTGSVSNITVLDIDGLEGAEKKEFRFGKIDENRKKELLDKRKIGLDKVKNKIKNIIGNPLIQENLGGEQLIYQYEPDLPKKKVDIEGIRVDIENNGGYIVISPSKLGITTRNFKELKDIPKIPVKLKEFLLEEINKKKKVGINEEGKEILINEPMPLVEPGGLGRSNVLVKMMGMYRQQFNEKDTRKIICSFNRNFCNPPIPDEVLNKTIFTSMEKYNNFDETELAREILEHVKEVKEITKSDLELSIAGEWTKGEAKKRFNKTMQYLIKEEKITQRGKKIKIVEDLDWKDTLIDIGSPVNFKVPYFSDYAYFCNGDIIILGSKFGYGKSTLGINIIKRLVDQKIKPYYIYSEKQGGRFARTATHLGLREGDFYSARCSNPDSIILRPNSVTIYDWVRPTKDESFARTDLLFDKLVEKAEKTNSFLICFVQLKVDDTFFAPNMIGQYPAVLAKYVHESNDGIYTKFVFEKIREPKIQGGKIEVPCIYNWKEKTVKLIEELDEKEREQIIKNQKTNKS